MIEHKAMYSAATVTVAAAGVRSSSGSIMLDSLNRTLKIASQCFLPHNIRNSMKEQQSLTFLNRNTVVNLDLNEDGNISFLEWAFKDNTLSTAPLDLLMERWLKYDVEGKGYLTIDEAYNRKA